MAGAVLGGGGVTDRYNEALGEELRKNVWQRTREAAEAMPPLDRAELVADVAGIFDPTPVSDGAGLAIALMKKDGVGALLSLGSMVVPYAGDALAKPMKIARKAPKVAEALEAMFKAGDKLAGLGEAGLKQAGLALDQVSAARRKALDAVQQAMLNARARFPNCEVCQGRYARQDLPQLQLPRKGGRWETPDGAQPVDGTGSFVFDEPRRLPNGEVVTQVDFVRGAPDFDDHVLGGKHQLWQVSGDAGDDADRLTRLLRQQDPAWQPPNPKEYTLHHFEDGSVGYVPIVLHDRRVGGVAHTGGNSMMDNPLF